MRETVSLKDILILIFKRWKLIALITMVAVTISAGLSYFVLTPVYKASTQILVNQKDANIQLDASQLRNHIELINTYSVIIKSPAILEKVINNLELPHSVEQLNQNIYVDRQADSVVFSVTVTDSNAGRAVEIANAVTETFQQEVKEIMNVDNVNILAKAELKKNPIPISPQPNLNIAIAVVLGLISGTGLALLLEFLDNTLKDRQDIEIYLGIPVLGSIQKKPTKKIKKEYVVKHKGVDTLESQVEKK